MCIRDRSCIISSFGLIILASGNFKSSLFLLGIFSRYLIMSYEKYPDIMELIEGNSLGILNLKLSITFSIFFFALPFKILTLLPKYILLTLLLNSQILSGFFPKIVYLP